jgi:hypothetical protein
VWDLNPSFSSRQDAVVLGICIDLDIIDFDFDHFYCFPKKC